ncbi:MAG: tetratricopeptide repeat protein [Acidobacteriota bacterium]
MRGRTRYTILAVAGWVVLTVACASTSSTPSATPVEVGRNDPLAATMLMQQGQALVNEGRIEAGVEKYRAALQLQPTNPTIHNLLGVAELQSGNAAKALASFNTALKLAPTYSDARNNRGAAYVQLGQYSMAEADFLTVLGDNLYANRAGVYFNLGSLYFGQGNYLAAEENLRKAAVDAGPVEAYALLARVQQRLGKDELAESTLRQAMARAPERADLVLALADLLEGEKRGAEARELYEKILILAPNSPEAAQARARLGK